MPHSEALGVEGVHSRVVTDRNRVTGGGVTAGLDFGLKLLAELRGERVAKLTQLMLEYDPQPPFQAGTPEAAGPEVTQLVVDMLKDSDADMLETARRLHRDRRPSA